jgi:hypothetical protein
MSTPAPCLKYRLTLIYQSTASSVKVDSDNEATTDNTHMPKLPEHVANFFAQVADNGYPSSTGAKAQPWLKVWDGIVEPDKNGELLVACPKKCDFGRCSTRLLNVLLT